MALPEAARWTGVSPKTIRKWIRNGLPQYRGTTRGKVLVRPGDIDLFLIREQAHEINLGQIVDEVMSALTTEK
jgi:predicted site-specific integrase-resolvase